MKTITQLKKILHRWNEEKVSVSLVSYASSANITMLCYARKPLSYLPQNAFLLKNTLARHTNHCIKSEWLVRSITTGKSGSSKAVMWKRYGKLVGVGFSVGAFAGAYYSYDYYKKITTPVSNPSEGGEYVLKEAPPHFNPAREVSCT